MKIKKYIPWPLKMALKLICSVLGITSLFQKLHIFEHGSEQKPENSFKIFNEHFQAVKPYLNKDFVVLELGPGYSMNTAVIAKTYGARFTYLVDKANFAKQDFKPIIDFLKKKNISVKDFDYQYLSKGLESLKKIPDKSVDFVFSQVVLEHVFKKEFLDILKELKRITKDNGVHSHTIDLKDHLNESLNHLRFCQKVWESPLFQKSGFYTNRIRYSDMIGFFKKAGFDYKVLKRTSFEKLPLKREKMDKEFCFVPEQDFLVSDFHILLFPLKQ